MRKYLLPFIIVLLLAGKTYADTLTVYPDADTETTTVDGHADWNNVTSASWATVHDAAGNNSDDTASGAAHIRISTGSSANTFIRIDRGIYLFDTSSLGASATISAATLSLYGTAKLDDANITPTINIYSSAPATNTAIVNGDYDSLGTTAFATAITYANWSTTAYNDFTLNATGISAISLTDITKFGSREATYDAPNSAPVGATAGSVSRINANYADQTGTTNDPKLVVTYTTPAGGSQLILVN